jgi:DNA-binding MarR family transcriptional regulator
MKAPESISANILFLTGLITNRLTYSINRSFREAEIDITLEQFSILTLLWYREGRNQQELANELSRDKTTVTRTLRNMFEKNLLVKVPDKTDRRNNLIYLTKKGKEHQGRCIRITGDYYVKALNNLSEPEVENAIVALNKIVSNIS